MVNKKIWEIHYIKPIDLIEHDYNPRIITDDRFDKLKSRIKSQGFRVPPTVDQNKILLAGHQRVKALIDIGLGETPIPVSVPRFELTEKSRKEILASDNISWGDFDYDILFQEFEMEDLIEWGFDKMDFGVIELETEETKGDDEVPESVPAITVNGDLYELGEHRLLCGDSTMIDDVHRLIDGDNVDITFTSPPYNADKNSGGLIPKKYNNHNDNMDDDDYFKFLVEFTQNSLMKSRFVFVNIQMLSHNKIPLFNYQNQFKNNIKDILIWNKNICPPQINKGTFNSKWEYIYCFSNEKDAKSRSFPCDWRGQYSNVLDIENNSRNEFAKEHKAGFPLAFPLWIIEKMDFLKSCYDPFLGTGTTLIACEKTNRKCYGMELDEKYCDVIVKRYIDFCKKNNRKIHVKRNGVDCLSDFERSENDRKEKI